MKLENIPSIKEIRRANPIVAKYDPFAYIADSLAPYFAKLFLYTPITANQISFIAYLLHVFGAFLIAINRNIVGALVLFQIVLVLDCIDGVIARLKNQKTFLGLYSEYIFHETAPPMVFFALGSYLYITTKNPIYLYLGGLIVIAQLIINSFGTSKQRIMYHEIRKRSKVPQNLIDGSSLLKEAKNPFFVILLRVVSVIGNYAFSIYVITLGYIFGFIRYLFLFYVVFYICIAFFKSVTEVIIGFKPYGLK